MRVHRYQSVLAFILSSLVGCSTLPEYEYSGPFKIEFGTITDNGEYYYMEEVTRTIQWKPTPDGFPIVGASVENTQKEYFELAFVVYFDEANNGLYTPFTVSNTYFIEPPVNPDYVAFISSDEIFPPGKYKFGIIVHGQEIQSTNFEVVWSKEDVDIVTDILNSKQSVAPDQQDSYGQDSLE